MNIYTHCTLTVDQLGTDNVCIIGVDKVGVDKVGVDNVDTLE